MTNSERLDIQKELSDKCNQIERCQDCPLYTEDSYYGCDNSFIGLSDEELVTLYNIMFPKPEEEQQEANDLINQENDLINHPKHYTNKGMECIDEMKLVFGTEAVMHFCLCNVWKYRYRADTKESEASMKKADWYLKKYAELKKEVTW